MGFLDFPFGGRYNGYIDVSILQEKRAMKKKVFSILQIGDKSNPLSRLFDIFIAVVICANILVTFYRHLTN